MRGLLGGGGRCSVVGGAAAAADGGMGWGLALFMDGDTAGTGLGGQTKGFVGEVDGRAEVCFFVHLLILLCSRGLLVYRGKIRPDGGGID